MIPTSDTKDWQASAAKDIQKDKNGISVDVLLNKSIRAEDIASTTAPTLLACSTWGSNKISIIELETKQSYANFEGVQINKSLWNHVKEIPNTKLLVSLGHADRESANMQIFDVSKKERPQKIYSFEKTLGVPGSGDVTYNSRRNLLGAIPLGERTSYHLFNIGYSGRNNNYSAKPLKKAKWHSQYRDDKNFITGFDFNPMGEVVSAIDYYGVFLISDINTDNCSFQADMGNFDGAGRCRWSTNKGESLLYLKYNQSRLNILDVEKEKFALKEPVRLGVCCWIDVCQNNGNLLVSDGEKFEIQIFDKRESKIVKTFDGIHKETVFCVRWSPNGDMIASASGDETVKLFDFSTGKVIHTQSTSEMASSVCFI